MCGRFVMTYSSADIQDFFLVSELVDADLAASWNVAPTTPIPLIVDRRGPRIIHRRGLADEAKFEPPLTFPSLTGQDSSHGMAGWRS